MRVAIVGGEKSLVEGNWGRRLAEHGLEVVSHFHDKNRTGMQPIPLAAEGVIIIRDMARHQITDPTKAEADKRGIPCASVPRKWSSAEPILRTQGILPPPAKPMKNPPVEARKATALAYIKEARSEGRIPKQDEVLGALKRAFGSNVRIGVKEYHKLCSEAAAEVPLAEKTDQADVYAEAVEWGGVIIAERPEVLLDRTDYHNQVVALLGPEADRPKAIRGADEAIEDAHKQWRADPSACREAMLKWLTGWWGRWQTGGAEFPRNTLIHDHAKVIFGVSARGEIIKEARATVLGDWARDLIELRAAQQHLDTRLATIRPVKADIRELLEVEAIKGIGVVPPADAGRKTRWYTSEVAIDEYVASLKAAPALKATAAVEIPVPESSAVANEPSLVDQMRALLAPLFADVVDIKTRLVALEAREPVVNVDVDLSAVNQRFEAVEAMFNSLTEDVAQAPAPSFAEALDTVIDGVKDRQVEVAIRPLPVSRG